MNEISHIEIYNEKWYLLKDICKILLLTNISETAKYISDKYKIYYKIDTVGGKQKMLLINLFGIKNIIQNTRSINKNKIIELLNINDLDIIFDSKESNYLKIICATYKFAKYITQYKINKYRIDLYFTEYNLAIEVDEFNHKDRDINYEIERQEYLINELKCKFIRFNPDEKNFNIGDILFQINEIIFSKFIK